MDENSRLTEFRQMKNEIRGSTKYLAAGIDIAKERHHAFFGRSEGRTLLSQPCLRLACATDSYV